MVMSCFAKITLKLLFGEIRLSELSQVIEKVKLKFIQILFLFFMLRPNLDFGIMILIILFSYIGFRYKKQGHGIQIYYLLFNWI